MKYTDELAKHALSCGIEGKAWLENIPNTVQTYAKKWDLQVFPPFENLTYTYVAPAVRADGAEAVLKIGFFKDDEFLSGVDALSVFNGEGSVKLLEEDKEGFVVLLEKIDPGVPLSSLADDKEATGIIAKVIKKLHKPLSKNHNFITVNQWTKELREYQKDGKEGSIPMYLVNKAVALFDELIETSKPAVLVHGDLHHDNILSSDRDEWLAIDPKGIAAEPAYETAAMVRNPYKKISKTENLGQLFKERIFILSEELNVDPRRIHKWGFAQTVLSSVWTTRDDGRDTVHALRVAKALNNMKID